MEVLPTDRRSFEAAPARRLLYVATVAGTIEGFLLPLANHFRALGWRVDAMANGIEGSKNSRESFHQVHEAPWTRSPTDVGSILRAKSTVLRVVRSGYDIVHVHTPVAGFVTRMALRDARSRLGVRVIYTAHGFHFHSGGSVIANAAFRSLEEMAARWTDELVVLNKEDQEAATRHGMTSPGHLHRLPGIGIETDHYDRRAVNQSAVVEVRKELGLATGDQLFVMIAEFTRNKRHDLAVRALAHLARQDVHLAFAGTGPLERPTEQLAQRLGVGDRVHLLGYRSDVRPLVLASIATLLCSEREGLPRAVLESLSLGVLCIGTRIRGTAELLDGDIGLLVPPRDANALTRAMAWALDRPKGARDRGRRGRAHVTQYGIEKVIEMHARLYERALDRAQAAPGSGAMSHGGG